MTRRVPGNDVVVLRFSTEVKADIITDTVIICSDNIIHSRCLVRVTLTTFSRKIQSLRCISSQLNARNECVWIETTLRYMVCDHKCKNWRHKSRLQHAGDQ